MFGTGGVEFGTQGSEIARSTRIGVPQSVVGGQRSTQGVDPGGQRVEGVLGGEHLEDSAQTLRGAGQFATPLIRVPRRREIGGPRLLENGGQPRARVVQRGLRGRRRCARHHA